MDINQLQNDLFALGEWCRTRGMRLNVEKWKVMPFHNQIKSKRGLLHDG